MLVVAADRELREVAKSSLALLLPSHTSALTSQEEKQSHSDVYFHSCLFQPLPHLQLGQVISQNVT